jgi:O-antigen/teichoic acid export membrane protein
MIPSIFFFIYHFFLSRQLGVRSYGSLSSLISLLIIAAVPAGIAGTVIMKYIAEFRAVEDFTKMRLFAIGALKIGGAAGLVACLGFLLFAGQIAAYLNLPDDFVVKLTGLALGLSLVLPLLRAILQGMQDYAKLAISATIDALGRAVLGIAFVRAGFGLDGAVGGIALATAISLLYTLVVVMRPLSDARASSDVIHIDLRRLLQSGTGVALGSIFMTILGYVDVPLVKHFLSAEEAGLFGATSLAGKVVLYAAGFVPMLVIPKAASRLVRGEPTPIVWMTALTATFAIVLPALAILALVPGVVLRVLTGSAFVAAAPLLLTYGAAMGLLAGSTGLVAYNVAVHRFHYLFPIGLAALGELAGIQLFHQSLSQVLDIILAANAVGFLGTLLLSSISEPRTQVIARVSENRT